jgi:hypothetical protein
VAAAVLHSAAAHGSNITAVDTSASAFTSAATGSTFIQRVACDPGITVTCPPDSKGNAYTRVGTQQTALLTGLHVFKCENGVGGAGHYGGFAFSAGTYPGMDFTEWADSGKTLQVDAGSLAQGTDTATPYTLTSGTFDAADTIAVLCMACDTSGVPISYPESTGFTQISSEPNNTDYYGGAIYYKALSGTGALTASITYTPGAGNAAAMMVFGLKSVSAGGSGITGAGQIASGEAVGSPAIGAGVAPAGVASSASVGTPKVGADIAAAGIATAQAFGSPVIGAGVVAAGIASAAAIGAPTLAAAIAVAGVPSAEAFGAPVVGGAGIFAAGIPSAAAFGSPAMAAAINAAGIASGEAVGAPSVGTPAPPTGRLGGFEMGGPREVSFKPLMQRILEARSERRVKPKKERAARRAKVIELEAAQLALGTGNQVLFQTLMAQWLAQRPVLPPAAEPSQLFLAQVLFRIQQMQAEAQAIAALRAAQLDEEEALLALLLA